MGKHTVNDGEIDEKKVKKKNKIKNEEKELKKKEKREKREKKEKKEKKAKGTPKISKIGIIARIILLASSIFLIYEANKTNMIPIKYMAIAVGIIAVINFLFLVVLIKNKKNAFIKAIASILVLAISTIFVLGAMTFKEGNEILNDMDISHKTLNFSVIVDKDSKYESVDNLKGKSM